MYSLLSISVSFVLFFHANGLQNDFKPQEDITSIFGAFGYSSSCIAGALATCENTAQSFCSSDSYKNCLSGIKGSSVRPQNCADLFAKGDILSGVRTVYPYTYCPTRPVSVLCDQNTDGGGWTVIQRREVLPQRENFFRTWSEYVSGFGSLTGEFWLGLDNIHALVSTTLMELRIDLEDFEGGKRWAKYGMFFVGNSEFKYILSIGRYSGDAGNSLSKSNGFKFSTHDADHDIHGGSCAKEFRGAWWYEACHDSNLNGYQHEGNHRSFADGINWRAFKDYHYSLKKTKMSVRPVSN